MMTMTAKKRYPLTHAKKHEETGGFLTENGMKMLAEGVVHLRKIPVSNGVCCTKMGDECCGDGRKMMTGIAKKFSGYNL